MSTALRTVTSWGRSWLTRFKNRREVSKTIRTQQRNEGLQKTATSGAPQNWKKTNEDEGRTTTTTTSKMSMATAAVTIRTVQDQNKSQMQSTQVGAQVPFAKRST